MFFWRRRHPVYDAALNAYVDGELAEAERARVEAHIEACPTCAGTLDELRSLGDTLSALPRARAPRSFALRASDVRPQPAPRWEGAFRKWQPALSGVALTAFAVFFLLVGVDVLGAPSSSDGDLLTAGEDAEAPAPSGEAMDGDAQLDVPGKASAPESDNGFTVGGIAQATRAAEQPRQPADLSQPTASPQPAAGSPTDAGAARDEDGAGDMGLRVAESVAAAVALTAGGSLAFVWWRRRAD